MGFISPDHKALFVMGVPEPWGPRLMIAMTKDADLERLPSAMGEGHCLRAKLGHRGWSKYSNEKRAQMVGWRVGDEILHSYVGIFF